MREPSLTKLLKKCAQCNTYTLNPTRCSKCGGLVVNAHPARFSVEDRYGAYRRKMKKELLSRQINENGTK